MFGMLQPAPSSVLSLQSYLSSQSLVKGTQSPLLQVNSVVVLQPENFMTIYGQFMRKSQHQSRLSIL